MSRVDEVLQYLQEHPAGLYYSDIEKKFNRSVSCYIKELLERGKIVRSVVPETVGAGKYRRNSRRRSFYQVSECRK